MKIKLIFVSLFFTFQSISAGVLDNVKVPVSAAIASNDFLFFKANRNGREVVLNWAYHNPMMVVFYYIERSNDGVNFTPLTDVMSNGETWYRYLDRSVPAGGFTYYRLTAFQHDGNIIYSTVESIRNQGNGCR